MPNSVYSAAGLHGVGPVGQAERPYGPSTATRASPPHLLWLGLVERKTAYPCGFLPLELYG